MHKVFHPDTAVLRGVGGEAHMTINSQGVRGPEWPPRANAYRILCVGNSITECLYLDDKDTWPALIMQRLNQGPKMQQVWVGGAGRSGYSCFHHLQFLRESELVGEVDCVVLMAGQSDFAYGISGATEPTEKPAPKKRKSWIEMFFRDVRKKLNNAGAFLDAHLLKTFKNTPPALDVEDATGQVYVARRQARMQAVKCDVLPDLSKPLDRFRERLREMVEACRRKQVRPIFVSSVAVYRKDLAAEDKDVIWAGKLPDGRYLTERALREGLDLFNKALEDAARELNVEFVDLSSLNGQPKLFYDGQHFNTEGTRQVANIMSDHFLARRSGNRWQLAAP